MLSDFKVTVLASGSKGNSTLIDCGEQKFLVDVGISCKQITDRLKQVSILPEQLGGVLITHEHSDHIKGLPVFTRKYGLPIFANEKTWQNIRYKNELNRSNCRLLPKLLISGNLKITPFSIPHDAAAPVGYIFETCHSKCTYLTDVGFITDEIRSNVENTDVIVLESNHDEDMVRQGIYPQALKQRILGTKGHLSNISAAWLLAKMSKLPKEIFLAHLSQENNLPSLALKTVKTVLAAQELGENSKIYVASQEFVVKNYD